MSPDYIQQAEERIKNAHSEKNIIMAELKKHVVQKTFKERKENGDYVGRYHTNRKIGSEKNSLFCDSFSSFTI